MNGLKERKQKERVKKHNKSCDCGCQGSDKNIVKD
jgi:hypothetical protein